MGIIILEYGIVLWNWCLHNRVHLVL